MTISNWSNLRGKTLTGTTLVGETLRSIKRRFSMKCVIVNTRVSTPMVYGNKINVLDYDSRYKYIHQPDRFVGLYNSPKIGMNFLRTIAPVNGKHIQVYGVKVTAVEFTHINDTKIEHLFGPDLRKWPLCVLILRYACTIWDSAFEDPQLREKLRVTLRNKNDFLETLALSRTVRERKKVHVPIMIESLSELFKV